MKRGTAIGDRDRSSEGRGRVALITGASAGIGAAMSGLLAAKGYDIVPVARRTERLTGLRDTLESHWGIRVFPMPADLARPDACEQLAASLRERGLVVDVLVNNAGLSQIGAFGDRTWDDHERLVRVMGLAVMELTHRLLPPMLDNGWGRIINVASIAAMLNSTPQESLYSATKAMIHRFSEGLAAEYADRGIHCTASLPGFTATEIFDAAGWGEQAMSSPLARLAMAPETVSRQAYRAVMGGRRTVVHGWHHKALATALQHAPLPTRRWMSNSMVNGAHGSS